MSAACPSRWLLVSLTACSCALVAAGCGSSHRAAAGPRLPRPVAQRLAADASEVASRLRDSNHCAAYRSALRLRRETTQAINRGQVPGPFQEDLLSAANSLVARISCVTLTIVPPPPPPPSQPHGKGKGHEKKHGGGEGDQGGGD